MERIDDERLIRRIYRVQVNGARRKTVVLREDGLKE